MCQASQKTWEGEFGYTEKVKATALFQTDVGLSLTYARMHAKSPQLCPTLCEPTDSSPPGSRVHGILQAGRLEWVAVSFSITNITAPLYHVFHPHLFVSWSPSP